MTNEEIKARAEALGPWYHRVELVPGWFTASNMQGMETVWDAIREVRATIPYAGRSVLDLGSFDGLWAFEAERLGARPVVASDVYQQAGGPGAYERFMLCARCFDSRAVLVPNGDAHRIHERLDSIRKGWGLERGFDIVQCLGLLYHLQNPILALRSIRRCCHDETLLLLETGVWANGPEQPAARYNAADRMTYDDPTTYWLPNLKCLFQVLVSCGFDPLPRMIRSPKDRPDRVLMVCRTGRARSDDAVGLIA